jgi:hypothetical protein
MVWPHSLNSVLRFIPQSLYPKGQRPMHPLKRRVGGAQMPVGRLLRRHIVKKYPTATEWSDLNKKLWKSNSNHSLLKICMSITLLKATKADIPTFPQQRKYKHHDVLSLTNILVFLLMREQIHKFILAD